jgi:hypothetical protein
VDKAGAPVCSTENPERKFQWLHTVCESCGTNTNRALPYTEMAVYSCMLQDCLGEVQMNNIYKYNTKMDSTDV